MTKLRDKYKHIIWDWNGTLLDDNWFCVEVINTLLAKRKMPLTTLAKYREIFGFPVIDYYKKLGFDFTKEDFREVSIEFIELYKKLSIKCTLHKKAKDILRQCLDSGLNQSILSAMEQTMLEQMLNFYDIRQFLENVIGTSDIYANGKTEYGRNLISSLQIDPKEILFIGDTVHDFEVALAMTTDCLLIANGHHSKTRLLETGCKVLDSIAGLARLL